MIFLVSNNDFWLVSKYLTKLKRNVSGNLFDYHQCYLNSFKECLCVKFYPDFSSCFSDAKLLISAERNRLLKITQSISYANSGEAYKVNQKLLQNTKLHIVVDHFMENWDSIKEQWVMFHKDQSFNHGETGNNRIESTFRHVKNVCAKYAS